MIKYSITEKDIEDEKTLFKYVEQSLKDFIMYIPPIDIPPFIGSNLRTIKEDYSYYYDKNQPYKYYINKVKYIDDTATSLVFGVAPTFNSYSNDENEKNKLIAINQKFASRGLDKAISEVGAFCGRVGVSYLLTYNKDKDEFPRYKYLQSENTYVVFNNEADEQSLFAVNFSLQTVVEGGKQQYYVVNVYTKDYLYRVRTESTTKFAISYLNNSTADKIRHYYKKVPITMFVNNVEEQSDSRCVYQIIDGYNSLQNNAIKNISTIINSILFIKNMRIGNKEEQSDMFDLLKEQNMLVAETSEDGGNAKKDVDAKFLNNPLNQDQVKILSSSLEDSIHQISGVPNFSSETFAQNSSGTALQLKLLGFINLGYNKQKYFTPSLLRVLKLTLNYLEYIKVDKYNVDLDNIYINYTMNIPSNDIDITTQIINLKNAGMLNPEVLLSKLSYVKDVDSYIKGIETPVIEKDINIDKSIDKSNNLTNNNINGEHNLAYTPLDKPNEQVQMDKTKRDNLKNYSKSL